MKSAGSIRTRAERRASAGLARIASRFASPLLGVAGALTLALGLVATTSSATPSPAPGREGARATGRTARIDGSLSSAGRAIPGGLSLGSPTDGHLVGGAHLEASPWLRVTPCYEGQDVRWGLDALVSLIDHGARAVRKEFPDSVLSVGHLSRRGGGDVDRHASHESGRDADVGFYITNQQGKPIYAEHFVRFLGDGTAPSWPGARFDDARNWAFVASIVTSGRAHVSYVFVASPLRERLLTYAQKIGAPYATRVRASELMAQPRGSLPHDDHFHVRISCPAFMEGCVEFPTRSLARANGKTPRVRSHGVSAPPGHAPMMHATRPPPPLLPEPRAGRAEVGSVTTSKATHRTTAEDEISDPSGPLAPLPAESAAPRPAPSSDESPSDPPASLDAPIDDVDGVLE